MAEVTNSLGKNFFLASRVKESFKSTIKERFESILNDHKLSWYAVYQDVGLSKSYASLIKNGHLIPPKWLRIKICERIGCDTSIIWDTPILISAKDWEIMKNAKQ